MLVSLLPLVNCTGAQAHANWLQEGICHRRHSSVRRSRNSKGSSRHCRSDASAGSTVCTAAALLAGSSGAASTRAAAGLVAVAGGVAASAAASTAASREGCVIMDLRHSTTQGCHKQGWLLLQEGGCCCSRGGWCWGSSTGCSTMPGRGSSAH